MGILNRIDQSAETGILAKLDRAMCRLEAREYDSAANRAQRHGDHATAQELRTTAQELRQRGGRR